MYKEASGTLTAAPCMLWLAASGFFCALLLREIYHSRVAPKGYPAARPLSWPTVLPAAAVAVRRLAGVGRLVPEDAPDTLRDLLLEWLVAQRNR